MPGFGKIIDIDLTAGTIDTQNFDRETALCCLGGLGFNTKFLYEHLPTNCDPLGPENILIISPGLLTGTPAPSSSRVHINALSPLSGLLGSSSVGGAGGDQEENRIGES